MWGDANKEDSEATTAKRTTYGKVVEKDGNKVFVVTNTTKGIAEDIEEFNGMDISNPKFVRIIRKADPGAKFLMAGMPSITKTDAVTGTKKPKSAKEAIEKIEGDEWARLSKGKVNYTIGDVHQAIKWLRTKFGKGLTVEMEDKLLEVLVNTGNVEAFGTFHKDAITLSKRLEVGTEYHEGFHRTSLVFLSPEQRKEIYAEARVKYGLRKATDREINEVLAEEYRSFELAGGKSKVKVGKIRQFFQDLWDFIHTLITGKIRISNLDINNLFRVMHKSNGVFGRLYVARPNKASVAELGSNTYTKVVKGRDLKYITSGEVLSTVVKNLVYETIFRSGVNTTKDINKLNYNIAQDMLKEKSDKYKADAADFLADGKTEDYNVMIDKIAFYKEIADNYDIFRDLMRDNLETIGIRTRLPEDPEDENDTSGFNFQRWDKASFELDGKDNAGTAIKFIVATLPASKTLDPTTGMKQFVEFDDMWDALQTELYKYDTVEEMMDVLSKKTAVPYQFLLARLERDQKLDKFDTLRTQFYIAMRKNRYDYDHGLINKKGGTVSVDIQNAETQRAGGMQSVIWGQQFFQICLKVENLLILN
jgi:hypothetical protein